MLDDHFDASDLVQAIDDDPTVNGPPDLHQHDDGYDRSCGHEVGLGSAGDDRSSDHEPVSDFLPGLHVGQESDCAASHD